MGNILNIIAGLLFIFWAVGFFGYHMGAIMHLWLAFAVIAILLNLIQGKKVL